MESDLNKIWKQICNEDWKRSSNKKSPKDVVVVADERVVIIKMWMREEYVRPAFYVRRLGKEWLCMARDKDNDSPHFNISWQKAKKMIDPGIAKNIKVALDMENPAEKELLKLFPGFEIILQ
jgi:hypothetical protein